MIHFSQWNLSNFTFTYFDCIASYEMPMSFAYPHPHWICRFSRSDILVLDLNLSLGFNVRNVRLVWMRVKYDIWPVISDHAVKMSHFSHWNLWILLWLNFDCIASYELPWAYMRKYAMGKFGHRSRDYLTFLLANLLKNDWQKKPQFHCEQFLSDSRIHKLS